MRYLVRIEVLFDGNSRWTMLFEQRQKIVFGDKEQFARLLRKLGASDDKFDPKSFRSMTYKNIVEEIMEGKDRIIWIWSDILFRLPFRSDL